MGSVDMFVDGPTKACISGDGYHRTECGGTHQWMMVDLGQARKLNLNHYALRHGRDNSDYALTTWELQGAETVDGPWTTLRRHDNDRSLPAQPRATAAWAVENSGEFFRVFRIVLGERGNRGGTNNFLHCSGIELYGGLLEE